MSESILQELEARPERLEVQAEVADRLHCLFTEEVGKLTAGLRGAAGLFGDAWLECVRAVAKGDTERARALRGRFVAA
jgi:hypothetical protein